MNFTGHRGPWEKSIHRFPMIKPGPVCSRYAGCISLMCFFGSFSALRTKKVPYCHESIKLKILMLLHAMHYRRYLIDLVIYRLFHASSSVIATASLPKKTPSLNHPSSEWWKGGKPLCIQQPHSGELFRVTRKTKITQKRSIPKHH